MYLIMRAFLKSGLWFFVCRWLNNAFVVSARIMDRLCSLIRTSKARELSPVYLAGHSLHGI